MKSTRPPGAPQWCLTMTDAGNNLSPDARQDSKNEDLGSQKDVAQTSKTPSDCDTILDSRLLINCPFCSDSDKLESIDSEKVEGCRRLELICHNCNRRSVVYIQFYNYQGEVIQ